MYKQIDHASFAIANVLLGSLIAKHSPEGQFQDFVIGISIALFIYSFIKLVFINMLALGKISFGRQCLTGYLCYISFFSAVGFTFYILQSHGFVFIQYACFLISIYISIDYLRQYYLEINKCVFSCIGSCIFLLIICLIYLLSITFHFIGLLEKSMIYLFGLFILISFFIVIKKKLYNVPNVIICNTTNISHSLMYWISNSTISNLPVLYISAIKPQLGLAFFALRTVFNGVSTLLRPKEIDLRMSLKTQKDFKYKTIGFIKTSLLYYITFFIFIIISHEEIFRLLYSTDFGITYLDLLGFTFYSILIWVVIAFENVCIFLDKMRLLSRVRLLDLLLILASLLVLTAFELDLYQVTFLLILSSSPSLISLLRLINEQKNYENIA